MGTITKKAFPVLNMHCAGCANNVEKTVRKLPGIVDASVKSCHQYTLRFV